MVVVVCALLKPARRQPAVLALLLLLLALLFDAPDELACGRGVLIFDFFYSVDYVAWSATGVLSAWRLCGRQAWYHHRFDDCGNGAGAC